MTLPTSDEIRTMAKETREYEGDAAKVTRSALGQVRRTAKGIEAGAKPSKSQVQEIETAVAMYEAVKTFDMPTEPNADGKMPYAMWDKANHEFYVKYF